MNWTIDALDRDTTLLTVNKRLATELRARYDQRQQMHGRRVWPSADILPWHAWLGRQYEQLLDTGFTELDLLSPMQERLLWQEVIERDPDNDGLLRPTAAAQSAQASYALLHDWQLDRHELGLLGGDETRRFLSWRQAFDAELRRRELLSVSTLLPLIAAALDQAVLTLPKRLVLSGFDSLSPQQQALFDSLRRCGCEVIEQRIDASPGRCRRVEATDGEAEIRLAAAWAHSRLAADSACRIAVVSAQITQQRNDLQRLFGEMVTPSAYLNDRPHQTRFNISLGVPLAQHPLVAHALLALGLLQGEQALGNIGQLLRSPFVGGHDAEWERRALLDALLRRDGLPRINLGRLLHRVTHLDPTDPRHCPDLQQRLEDASEWRRALPGKGSPARWAGLLQGLLKILGWPGDQALNSQEYQLLERFRRTFSELAGLGKVRPRMRLADALQQLRALSAETLFQAESAAVPIQILGPLEAAGLHFDAVWLLGMHDQNWPPAPQPDPLLPAKLQRELGMPHASAERELAFAASLIHRLGCSAGEVIASHASKESDRDQRATPLTLEWPLTEPGDLLLTTQPLLRDACAAGVREALPSSQARRAPAELRGGAALLGSQASCPFQAIASFRMKAQPLDEPSHAADGALLGALLHELLQRVWQQLRSSQSLAQHDDAALHKLIEPLATATLEDIGRRRPDLFTPRFRAIESARLTRLLLAWLTLERQRGQAFEVIALEQDQQVELEGLRLMTRADRIDRLGDGSLAIIDYKSGRLVSSDGWYDARLSEPQLPLYCLHTGGEVSAALLARVRNDDKGCRFVGLSREAGVAPGVGTPQDVDNETDWALMLARWRQALGGLAREIADGRADITPSRQACQYCAFGPLCRKDAVATETGDD